MTWILFIVFVDRVEKLEFPSKATCEEAKELVVLYQANILTAECVQ